MRKTTEKDRQTRELENESVYYRHKRLRLDDRHSSVVSSAPTILRPRVQIPSTPSMLFSICVIEIVLRK